MSITHQDLLNMASRYNGRSCDVNGESADSITATNDDGTSAVGGRMDQNGTFRDVNECCLVSKCVFGKTESSCTNFNLECPSRWGTINPRTCEKETLKHANASDDNFFRTQGECCHHNITSDGCIASSPWEKNCCNTDNDSNNILSSGRSRDEEDFLTT